MKLASSNAACHCDLCLPDEVRINLDMKDPTTFKKNNSKPEKNQRPWNTVVSIFYLNQKGVWSQPSQQDQHLSVLDMDLECQTKTLTSILVRAFLASAVLNTQSTSESLLQFFVWGNGHCSLGMYWGPARASKHSRRGSYVNNYHKVCCATRCRAVLYYFVGQWS